MTETNNRPPLWEAMQDAYFKGRDPGFSERHGYAAEIRALRDWLVPEEAEPRIYEHCDRDDLVVWHRWDECQSLRALLTAEADRAERGDG